MGLFRGRPRSDWLRLGSGGWGDTEKPQRGISLRLAVGFEKKPSAEKRGVCWGLRRVRAAHHLHGASVGRFEVAVGEGQWFGLLCFSVGFCEFPLRVLVEEFEHARELSVELHISDFLEVGVFEPRFVLDEERGIFDDGGPDLGEVRFREKV